MLVAALLTLWLIYAVFIVRFVRNQLTSGLKYITKENLEVRAKYDCFARKDIPKWNHLEMYFVAIFLFPFRLFQFLSSVALLGLFMRIIMIGTTPTKISAFRRTLIKAVVQSASRSCLFALGFYRMNHIYKNISDIDPTYSRIDALKHTSSPAPIVISNHVSWTDIFVVLTTPECPSFLAKLAVKKYPLFGPIAEAIGTLFVERESKEQRGDIVAKLKEREEAYAKEPSRVAPVMIFPEGTTSNGEYLLSFKKGAFSNFSPLKVYGLKYTKENFSPALDTLGTLRSFLFIILQLYNGITLYDLGTYYPDNLNLQKEEDWTIYAQKIKDILLKTLDLKSTEMGYSDFVAYDKTLTS